MSPPRPARIAAALVLLGIGGLLWWMGRPTPALPDRRADSEPTVRRFDVREPPSPRVDHEPTPHTPPGPDSSAAAHARIAESLGLVAIRCWVGADLDTNDLVGEFHQRIEGGWYSHVESVLEGTRGVEQRFETAPDTPDGPPGVDFQTLFFVSWKADAPGQSVPCTVTWPRYAELVVRVVDVEGAPVADARVYGCSGNGQTDADGVAAWQMFADRPCDLTAYHSAPSASTGSVPTMLQGTADVPGVPENAEHHATLVLGGLDIARMAEQLAGIEDAVHPDTSLRSPLDAAGWSAEGARFDAMARATTGPAATLLRGLAEHREVMADLLEQQDAEREEREASLRALRATLPHTPDGEIDLEAIEAQLEEVLGD